MRKFRISVFALLLCTCFIAPFQMAQAADAPATAVHGSGSYQLNSVPTDYRFYTEYFVKADTNKSIRTAGIDRRTAIKVYANAGEIILFGSSVSNSQIDVDNQFTGGVTDADIVITTPTGIKIPNNVLMPGEDVSRPNGLGYIKNPTQEMNGPMVNSSDEAHPEQFYVPLKYEVLSDGVYTFEFHSVTGFNPNSAPSGYHPSPKKANAAWAQGNTAVAAWDITVLGKDSASNWEVKEGRAWADYLALTTAGSVVSGDIVKSDLNVHVLSHDGYQYKVDFTQTAPYGFIFFANNTGFMSAVTDEADNTTYRPIYHSFYDSSNDLDGMTSGENIYLHKPDQMDTETEETYKIFFNAPNADLNGVAYTRYGITDTLRTEPEASVLIQDLVFSGVSDKVARTGHGGYFTFHASGEATVTIRLDLRKAILESEGTMDTYTGSGIVEITAPAVKTTMDPSDHDDVNKIYWDGKDTEGITIPAGIYGNNNVVISTEVKRGELHFPVIDLEGLYGGLTVERLNGTDPDRLTDRRYDLYYNNNPLAYGTIEGKGYTRHASGSYYVLSDATKSYKVYTDTVLAKYFAGGPSSISTLKKDDKEYLAQKLFATSYTSLDATKKSIIDAEFDTEQATFHYEAVNSNSAAGKMTFKAENYDGGGNRAGIDAWTYYSSGVNSDIISFAVMDTNERGMVTGQIFYDAHDAGGHPDSAYDVSSGDYMLPGIKVRLIDSEGNPLVHQEKIPSFDESGHFKYDQNGDIIFDQTDMKYETVTDATGTYRFTNVPYSSTEDTTYYVQVMLTDVQSEVMRYTCTTSNHIKNTLKTASDVDFLTATIDTSEYGADGNTVIEAKDANGDWDTSKIYRHKYARTDNETVFVGVTYKDNLDYAQSVTFSTSDVIAPGELVKVKEFKKIGFSSTVPDINEKEIKVVKSWQADVQGNTHTISDGLIVELWVWNDDKVQEVNTHDLTRRTGALLDTQILNEANSWTYTWKNLDDRLQYYVLEYYAKKKPNGEVIHNDNGEPRKVLIGGTMPIFGADSTIPADHIYGFDVSAGAYAELMEYPVGSGTYKIPVQQFGDGIIHTNALTDKEKLESVENNARQYDVNYTLTKENLDKTNVITLYNSQVYDDRTYYVWLNHEAQLPEMIALTYVETDGGNAVRKSHAVSLVKDENQPLEDGTFAIKGLSVSSVDAALCNTEGNATKAFRIKEADKKYAFFTATDHGNYKTGTGTRTYRVKYVVRQSDKSPVSLATVSTTDAGTGVTTVELVEAGTDKKVEKLPAEYIVYSWYMTIHVYDVKPDGVIEYDPEGGTVTLQKALNVGEELNWQLHIDESNENAVQYTSTDTRTGGILANDTYRLPLYKHAEHPNMGSCADIVGIAYAGSFPVEDDDISSLVFADTYESRYGSQSVDAEGELGEIKEDGKAEADGSGGFVEVSLNTHRITRINRTQDHANYATVTFTPTQAGMARALGSGEDVFYYKVIVFAEDNTYQYTSYDEMDASEGVEMYTYFTMRPRQTTPPDGGDTPGGGDAPGGGDTPGGGDAPDGGDNPDGGDEPDGGEPDSGDDPAGSDINHISSVPQTNDISPSIGWLIALLIVSSIGFVALVVILRKEKNK